MNFPGRDAHAVLVGRVAPPQGLDQGCSWLSAPDHVLLALLLLDLQGETGAQNSLVLQNNHD